MCVWGGGETSKVFLCISFFFPLMSLWMEFERLDVGGDVCLFPERERLRALSLEHTGGGTEALQAKDSCPRFRPKSGEVQACTPVPLPTSYLTEVPKR